METGSPVSIPTRVVVSFRGTTADFLLTRGSTTVGCLKAQLATSVDDSLGMSAGDVKILHKGRVLSEDDANLYELLVVGPNVGGVKKSGSTRRRTVRLMATGASTAEVEARDRAFEEGARAAPRIRDDISQGGITGAARRREEGQRALEMAAARSARTANGGGSLRYGFGAIEIFPNLPERDKAREILTSLANDPGILACMAKHKWNVGCLAEMFPKGYVGQDEVCVMGLNQNKGQKILLRLRTDDLKGFRKNLSIRKVLFHELAHNVHSDHNGDFFLLMRQIEKECNEMDWKRGSGSTTTGTVGCQHAVEENSVATSSRRFEGGTRRLGGDSLGLSHQIPARDLAARAAVMRLTVEEEEIRRGCGCEKSKNSGNE
uniref:WLM domain-containing protein n=1 Tax=Odontella aurita TaxID=265563 RepID=A0A7S4N2I3_9STRA|mmetsp:Transcript_45453/g.138248  ORF Transcript_45453/g.138248 Transcript_45453/m.138248 type:complete len:376 (+) Transcript_45453:148-1275(+)|eukprot:CAMPEP_0113555918 /NCGR_PEP_ID=MMETSP0015_2-20120614/16978_1 /TAXON_ID=2838 /ORGANISM="Odontella" /LENGTH=375 /DNA_ID=CAMNT_0000457237 /DNA_START=77 /DNA_END=1204 /DNA_ORIENTATION=- /assembly_acc=CAM_ASM_000160